VTAERTQVLLAWSGGKDSAWTLRALQESTDVEVVALLTTVTAEYDRSSMQGVRREVLRAQAAAAGLPLLEAAIPAACDNATYDAAMARALAEAGARWPGLRTVAFGDLFLEDLRAWRIERCAAVGWAVLTPLFGSDTATLAREMIAGGLRAGLCCVDTEQLDASYAGRDFDATLLASLPGGVDACGENGEFHSCVWDGPMFERPVALRRGETVLRDGRFAYTDYPLEKDR
jgi:uncharacterized protein (TIGR00290 family)